MSEAPPGDALAAALRGLKPYDERFERHARLPARGRSRDELLAELEALAGAERAAWQEGRASGAVYHGDREHVEFVNRAYALHSQSNPLHVDLWPSATKFEAEVVAMTAALLGAEGAGDEIVGTVTSGGTESIVLAVKAYRDRAGLEAPEMVLPTSAHAAFDKAAQLLGVRAVRIPVAPDGRADLEASAAAIGERTILVVGSAPGFPHGLIDPIEELSELARARGVGFHADACLGGFLLPWAERLGRVVPPFDFRLPGVASMSADTHKFGYAPKGTSVILYRGAELRHHQYFTVTDWPGGLYSSPTLPGSRPGGLVAACWAALLSVGEAGYLEAARRILATADELKRGIAAVPELSVIGDPLFCIAFRSEGVDVYRVMDAMGARGWSLNGLQRPPAVHICVTLRHTRPGVAERFVADLRESVAEARDRPSAEGGMAPIYGMAASLPGDDVADLLAAYMDVWYRV